MNRRGGRFGILAAVAAFAIVGTGCQAQGQTSTSPPATAASRAAAPSMTGSATPAAPASSMATTPATSTPSTGATATDKSVCASASYGQTAATMAAARAALAPHLHSGEHQCVVGLPGGFEAVLFNDTGGLRFWSSVDGVHWGQDQQSAYRYDARDAKGQQLTVRGTKLAGMSNVTFILNGIFTGDGSGNAMVYTVGPSGWGPVVWPGAPDQRSAGKLEIGTKLPPADSMVQVSFYKAGFAQGDLVTYDCDASHSGADCGANLIASDWRWNPSVKGFEAASHS